MTEDTNLDTEVDKVSKTEVLNGVVKDNYFSMNPFCSVVSFYVEGIHLVTSDPSIYYKTMDKVGKPVSILASIQRDDGGILCGDVVDVVD